MPIEITMPKLSDTMEEGTILRWFKQVGQQVNQGEVIVEVETDKADMEIEAEASGVMREIRVGEGKVAAVGAVLAVLSDVDGATDGNKAKASTAPAAKAATAPTPPPARSAPPTPPTPSAPAAPARAVPSPAKPAAPSPHVAAAAPSPTPPAPSATKWTPRTTTAPSATSGRQEVSKLHLTVAKQMTASKRETPHFYVTCEVDMSEAARLRDSLVKSGAIPERITYTHLLIRALAETLPRHPHVNASWSDGSLILHSDVNIGIAVAVDDGLLAPVLHGCQTMTLRQIARATHGLVEKAQAGRFTGAEMTGATFTISNMGMLDIDEFSAVITPPQAAILAVGAIKERPIVRNGALAIAKTMRVTLSVDHRVLNGVEAGRFLEDLKHVLETPVVLVIGNE